MDGVSYLSNRKLNQIRGKLMVGKASKAELIQVFEHLECLELALDVADRDDALGTEGWRRFVGYPESD